MAPPASRWRMMQCTSSPRTRSTTSCQQRRSKCHHLAQDCACSHRTNRVRVAAHGRIYGFSNDTSVDPAPMSGFIKVGACCQRSCHFMHRKLTAFVRTGACFQSYTGVLGQNSTSGEFIMRCFDPTHVPVITTLGSEFAIIDHWFSGIPGPTEVNRAFANSGTSYGYVTLRDKLWLQLTPCGQPRQKPRHHQATRLAAANRVGKPG